MRLCRVRCTYCSTCQNCIQNDFDLNESIFFVDQADRTESYTRITPFQEKHDTSVEYVLLLGGPRSYPVRRLTHAQILLQAINSISTFLRFDRPCLCRNNPGCAGGGARQETRVRPSSLLSVCSSPYFMSSQGGIRRHRFVSSLRHDTVSRWTFRPASSCLLADNFRRQSSVRAGSRLLTLPGRRYSSSYADLHRLKSRCTIAREKLCRGLFIDTPNPLGMTLFHTPIFSLQWLLECDRYLLLSACSRMVREGNDSTRLLVLLG